MKICVLDGGTMNPGDNPWTPVERLGTVDVYPSTPSTEIVQRAADAEIIITNKVPLNAATFQQLPKLKMVAVSATGYNVVDVAEANRRGIVVSNVPVYSTDSVAQHVFAMVLSFIHRSEEHDQAIEEGQWQKSGQFSFWLSPICELKGKQFGVIGFGRIGQATARIARAFGMELLVSSRTQKTVPGFENAQWLALEDVFEQADIVSLHCPQTVDNGGFVNADLLTRMKPDALLVNTARGGLINEQDLAKALDSNQIGGACLDVLSTEPPQRDNPLLSAQNCLLTPHIAWTALEARKRLMQTTADNIAGFMAGNPINQV